MRAPPPWPMRPSQLWRREAGFARGRAAGRESIVNLVQTRLIWLALSIHTYFADALVVSMVGCHLFWVKRPLLSFSTKNNFRFRWFACARCIPKICQTAAGKSMTSQFPKFFVCGFLLFGPTVNCATQGRSPRARTVANALFILILIWKSKSSIVGYGGDV